MLHGRDIVILACVEWEPLWQGQQEMASRLAREGNRVVFVENTGVRGPTRREGRRLAARLARGLRFARSRHGMREVEPGLQVFSPLVLPPFGSTLRRAFNRRVLLPRVVRSIRRAGVSDPVIVTHLPTDTSAALIGMLKTAAGATVYYSQQDFTELASDPEAVRVSERAIVAGSDLVFASCPRLVELAEGERVPTRSRRGPSGPAAAVHLFPSGVSLEDFAPDTDPVRLVPGDGPVVGYVGGVHTAVDLGLVAAAARRRPDWSWVLVGPLQRNCDELAVVPNVHLVGARPHPQLAGLIAGFDVGIVPYVLTPATETVVPTKVAEYLAMGKPVVSTDLPSLAALPHLQDVVTVVPADADRWVDAVEQALVAADAPTAERDRTTRMAAAAASGWGDQLEAMSALIEKVLAAVASGGGDGGSGVGL